MAYCSKSCLGPGQFAEQALGGLLALPHPARAVQEELRVVAEQQLRLGRQAAVAVLGAGRGARAVLQLGELRPGPSTISWASSTISADCFSACSSASVVRVGGDAASR